MLWQGLLVLKVGFWVSPMATGKNSLPTGEGRGGAFHYWGGSGWDPLHSFAWDRCYNPNAILSMPA